MTTRQSGRFFFEPRGYDHVNQATHEHKEEIKVGYNLRRKVVLYEPLGADAGGALALSIPRWLDRPGHRSPGLCT